VKSNYEGVSVDLTKAFIDEEYLSFPVALHDDMLDSLARVLDEGLPVTWPMAWTDDAPEDDDDRGRRSSTGY
jgi:hypothetical protein